MARNDGTLTISDLFAQTSGTVADIESTTLWDVFRRALAAQDRQMKQMVETFCEFTTERLRGTGGVTVLDFEEMGEDETPHPQKAAPGENLGIPMRFYAAGQQWTDLYLEESTPADLAGQFLAILAADRQNIIRQINRAIYLSANYTSTDIRKKDQASLPIKRLANADSMSIPLGPNGETFTASSHTHYVARVSTFAASDLDSLITNAGEHYPGMVKVGINSAQEAAVRAFTGFTAVVDARIVQTTSTAYVNAPGLDLTNRGDRLIGIYNGAEIWVKPWAIANYLIAWNTGAPKVCSYRTRRGIDDPRSGLRPIYDQKGYPLNNKGWGREFGIGVTGRVSAALLYVGGTSWADPTITNAS